MNAGIYCRVSTDDQEREGTSLQTQMESCSNYCLDKGYQIVQRFSEAYSGLTLQRPKLKQLMELARNRSIDVIVIYCLDRISRDPTHGVILTQELESLNVSLEAVTENVESSDLGKLINYIKGFASKLEAEKIKERTLRGKAAHAKNGKLPIGTGIGIYGYEWDKTNKKRGIIDHEAETVRNIFNLAIQGTSTNKIAITLNEKGTKTKSGSVWYPLTVRRILTNTTYTGKTYYGQTKRIDGKTVQQPEEEWILLNDVTPPIITDEIFNLAQETMKITKQSRPVKQNAHYLLTGFIRCPKCGSPIGGTMLSGKYRYYQCRGAKPTATRGKICDAGYIKADEIENFVWEKLGTLFQSPFTVLSYFTNFNIDSTKPTGNDVRPALERQIKQLKKKLKAYPSKEKNLYDLLMHESVTKEYVLESIDTLRKNKEQDEKQLEHLMENIKQFEQGIEINLKLTEMAKLFKDGYDSFNTLEEKRELLSALAVQVSAVPGNYRFTCFIDAELTSDIDEGMEKKWSDGIKEFESLHPEITFGNILDQSY